MKRSENYLTNRMIEFIQLEKQEEEALFYDRLLFYYNDSVVDFSTHKFYNLLELKDCRLLLDLFLNENLSIKIVRVEDNINAKN